MYRWTKTMPSIEYCENVRYSRNESFSEPNIKIPKYNKVLNATEDNGLEVKSLQHSQNKKGLDGTQSEKKNIIDDPKHQKEIGTDYTFDNEHESGSKLCTEVRKASGEVESNMDNMSNWETDFPLSKIELSEAGTSNEESQLNCERKKEIIKEETEPHAELDRDYIISKPNVSNDETTDAAKNVLPEKKTQKYYEEYDDFIQSLSSPLNQTHAQNSESAMLSIIFNQPMYTDNVKYSPTIEDSKESETSDTSTSSDSSSSESSSSSSTSDSSSNSDSSSDDDSATESDEYKEKSQR